MAKHKSGFLTDHIDEIKMEYMKPNKTMQDLAKKYDVSIHAIYYLATVHKWGKDKKLVNEMALLESICKYIKDRKTILLKDLNKIDGIEDKVFKKLKNMNTDDIKVTDLVALLKCKYDLLTRFGTDKSLPAEQTINEGDSVLNINISDSELDIKVANLIKDLKFNGNSKDNRLRALISEKTKRGSHEKLKEVKAKVKK